jgi:quinol monooxygenase YgiN
MDYTVKTGFHIQVSLFIAPEKLETFFAAFKPVYDKTIAEPECIALDVFQPPDDPGHILLAETW